MPPDFEQLKAQNQKVLVEFLDMDLGLVQTFVEIAALEKAAGDMDHYNRVKDKAMRGAEAIRRFLEQVLSAERKAEISQRLQSIEKLISEL